MEFSLSRSLFIALSIVSFFIALSIVSFFLQVNNASMGIHTRLLSRVSFSSTPSKRPLTDRLDLFIMTLNIALNTALNANDTIGGPCKGKFEIDVAGSRGHH
jgi:hypothetical protein